MYRRAMPNGRLADPDCTLGTDPRSDPRMVKAFAQFGLDGPAPEIPLTVDSPLEDRLAWAVATEEGFAGLFEAFAQGVPIAEGVTTRTVTIAGGDGNDVTLYISRPADAEAALPAVVHLHGGGMAILSAAETITCRAREYLAGTGLVVVGVEFRNSAGKLGVHPYPAGLNDCAAAVQWVAANRAELGISHLIVSGESGGGNLTLDRCAQGEAGRLVRRDRRLLCAVSDDFESLARRSRRSAVAERERRILDQLSGAGADGFAVRPRQFALARCHMLGGRGDR